MGLCRSLRMRHELSAAAFRKVWPNPNVASTHTLVSNGWRRPWVCAAVSGCGASCPPLMNSRVPCDSAMAKSPHCQYSYVCLKRLAPPVGLCRSLQMRRKLSAAYEFTRSVSFSHGETPALPVSTHLSQTLGATRVFVPQSPDAAQGQGTPAPRNSCGAAQSMAPWPNG